MKITLLLLFGAMSLLQARDKPLTTISSTVDHSGQTCSSPNSGTQVPQLCIPGDVDVIGIGTTFKNV